MTTTTSDPIETTATESVNETETENTEQGPNLLSRGWHKVSDPIVATTTGAVVATKTAWLKGKAYRTAKAALKEQMTAEGLAILAAERVEREKERAAKESKDAEIARLKEELAKLQES